jgi:hypothetical protein
MLTKQGKDFIRFGSASPQVIRAELDKGNIAGAAVY